MKRYYFYFTVIPLTIFLIFILSCKSIQKPKKEFEEKFFTTSPSKYNELFRVKITPTEYKIKQLRAFDKIKRYEDPKGDKRISAMLQKYQGIIKTKRIGVAELWIFADIGKPMRIRIKKSTGIYEFDQLINEDLTRWRFKPIPNEKTGRMFIMYLIELK